MRERDRQTDRQTDLTLRVLIVTLVCGTVYVMISYKFIILGCIYITLQQSDSQFIYRLQQETT